jgi:hypothetical protein
VTTKKNIGTFIPFEFPQRKHSRQIDDALKQETGPVSSAFLNAALASFGKHLRVVTNLKMSISSSIKERCNHGFIQMTGMSRVRDVAFCDRLVSVPRKDVAPVWTRSFPISKEPTTLPPAQQDATQSMSFASVIG